MTFEALLNLAKQAFPDIRFEFDLNFPECNPLTRLFGSAGFWNYNFNIIYIGASLDKSRVLCHELGHYIGLRKLIIPEFQDIDSKLEEVIAESTCQIVSKHFGFDFETQNVEYIIMYLAHSSEKDLSLINQIAAHRATLIITALEGVQNQAQAA